jgi:hypothetical protein
MAHALTRALSAVDRFFLWLLHLHPCDDCGHAHDCPDCLAWQAHK